MAQDVPAVFGGIVEVDETCLGGQKKNKRKSVLLREKQQGQESKRGFGTKKQPVVGILCRDGKVWATLVENTEAEDLIPIIEKKVKNGKYVVPTSPSFDHNRCGKDPHKYRSDTEDTEGSFHLLTSPHQSVANYRL